MLGIVQASSAAAYLGSTPLADEALPDRKTPGELIAAVAASPIRIQEGSPTVLVG